MSKEDEAFRRVRFYGVDDLAAGWHVPRVVELVEQFDPNDAPTSTVDILELHNVQRYLEHGLLPRTYTDVEQARAKERIPQIRGAVARHFSRVDNSNFTAMVAGIGHDYHADLLDLLGRNRVFDRCDAATVLPALASTRVQLGDLLASKNLVTAYDAEIREMLRVSPRGAEHVIRKYLQDDVRAEIHLPPSFTPADSGELLVNYVDDDDANPNYIALIASSKEQPDAGIDDKLKLRAKRRHAEMNASFFEQHTGFKTGCEVGISDDQAEPVLEDLRNTDDELVARYTYSRRWLDETLDNPSILNNFIHLFDFVDRQALLNLPSYPAQLGVMERFMGTPGKTEYRTGAAFRAIDLSSLLQIRLYIHYLETKDLNLEQVISWFFQEYLVEEFGAANFSFTPSDPGTSYLQKVRHLFAEMDSVAKQFALYVRDGELDRDLLSVGSKPVTFKDLPSLLDGKYIYPNEETEMGGILYALFSDQSSLTYIDEDLQDDNAALLLARHHVAYNDFHDYQKPSIDHLIRVGVLENTGARVQLANFEQFLILNALFTTQAASYHRLSETGRGEADAMVAKGWATRGSSLLTEAEGKYFNYFLNAAEFSNGPELRNRYMHGSQVNTEGEDAHFHTYLIALRMTIALVVKINDDFDLAATARTASDRPW